MDILALAVELLPDRWRPLARRVLLGFIVCLIVGVVAIGAGFAYKAWSLTADQSSVGIHYSDDLL